MKQLDSRTRGRVDRMLREAAAAQRYATRGSAAFFDLRNPELRDAIELRVLHFLETSTRLGRPFRNANPLLPWDQLDRLRSDLVHEYPEVRAETIWRFVTNDLPRLVSRLRRARYPEET